MKKIKKWALVFVPCMIMLCVGCSKEVDSFNEKIAATSDPTERGLLYVAAAIVVAAIIRGIMNK